MADAFRDELRNLVASFRDADDKFPDFRLCIITGPVLSPRGEVPGKPALFDPFDLPAEAKAMQKRAADLLDLLASETVPLLMRMGVNVGNDDAIEPTRLVHWAAENSPSFNKQPCWGDGGRGITARPSEYTQDNELLTPKANVFLVIANALNRLAIDCKQPRPDDASGENVPDQDQRVMVAVQQFAHAAWEAKLDLYRVLFSWIGPAIKEVAGLSTDTQIGPDSPTETVLAMAEAWRKYKQGTRSGDERITKILQTARDEFRELTGLPTGLGTAEEWQALAMAAGIPRDEYRRMEFCDVLAAVRVWCFARKAQHHKPADATPSRTTPTDNLADGETPEEQPRTQHAIDFRSVRWFGTTYTFTAAQAACVRLMWEHWGQGTPAVGEQTILEAADASGTRLRDLFRNHPAWNAMISPAGKGAFQLSEPTIS